MPFRKPFFRAVALALAFAASPLRAQVNAGIDLDYGNDYVWRGITRASSPTLRPQAWIGFAGTADELTLGAWKALELGPADAAEITTRGRVSRAPAELDLWAQYTRHLPGVDAAVGAIRYLFRGDPGTGGLGDDASTTELYAQLWPTSFPALEPRATLYHDVERTRGTYLEVDGTHAFSLFPLVPTDLLLGATAGFSLRAPRTAPAARGWESFAGTGATHLDLRAGVAVRADPHWAGHLTYHHQRSYDDATRRVRLDRTASHHGWWEGGVSLTLGRERRPR
jgi:hypothetical protein